MQDDIAPTGLRGLSALAEGSPLRGLAATLPAVGLTEARSALSTPTPPPWEGRRAATAAATAKPKKAKSKRRKKSLHAATSSNTPNPMPFSRGSFGVAGLRKDLVRGIPGQAWVKTLEGTTRAGSSERNKGEGGLADAPTLEALTGSALNSVADPSPLTSVADPSPPMSTTEELDARSRPTSMVDLDSRPTSAQSKPVPKASAGTFPRSLSPHQKRKVYQRKNKKTIASAMLHRLPSPATRPWTPNSTDGFSVAALHLSPL